MKTIALTLTVVICVLLAFAFDAKTTAAQGAQTASSSAPNKSNKRVVHFNMQDARWEKHSEFGGAEWVIHRSPDGKRVLAAWQESGKVSFTYPFDEFVYVIKGRAKVWVHGGASFELVPGDVAYFEEGTTVDFEFSEGFTDVTVLVSDREVRWR